MANIANDQNEYVKALERRKKETIAAARAEEEFRRQISETVRVLKNEKDIQSALSRVQTVFSNGADTAKRKLSELNEKLDASKKMAKGYSTSLKYNEKKMQDLGKRTKANSEKYDKYSKRVKILSDRLKKQNKTNAILGESSKKMGDTYKNLNAEAGRYDEQMNRLNSILEVQIGTWDDLERATDLYIKQQERIIDQAVRFNKMSPIDAKNAKDKLRSDKARLDIQKKIGDTTPEVERERGAREKAKKAAALVNRPKGKGRSGELIAEEMSGRLGKMGGSLGTLLKGKGGIFGGIAAGRGLSEAVRDYKDLKEKTLGAGKGAKLLGGNITMLGKAFEGLSKGNIFLLIAGMVGKLVKQLYDGIKDLDKWLKDYNKTFMQIYGPTTMMKDVKGSITTFTNAVFDMNRNLALGLKSEDIMGLFKALSQGGLTMTAVAGKFGGYDKAIRESVKMSRDFGVSMEEMGGMVTDQMMEMGSSLKEVKSAFDGMSYDASIAGIQSQKFYQAVYTASSALSMYGNYLDDASGKLQKYIKTGAIGFQDAAKQTEAMEGAFKSMSVTQAATLVSMSGDMNKFKGYFEEEMETRKKMLAETLPAEMKALENRRASGAITDEEYLKAKEENERKIRKVNGEVADLSNVLADKTGMAMYNHMEYLSSRFDSIMANLMSDQLSRGVDIFKEGGIAFEQMAEQVGMNSEQFRIARKNFLAFESAFTKIIENPIFTKGLEDIGKVTEKGKTKEDFLGDLSTLKEKGGDIEAFTTKWGETLKSLGMSTTEFQYQMETNSENMIKLLRGGKGALPTAGSTEYRKMMLKAQVGTAQRFKQKSVTPDSNRLDAIIDATTSLEEYVGIGKENLQYVMASNKLTELATSAAIATAKGVFNISNLLTKWARKKDIIKSEEEFSRFQESKEGLQVKEKLMIVSDLESQYAELAKKGGEDTIEAEALRERIKKYRKEAEQIAKTADLEERMSDMQFAVSSERTAVQTKIAKEEQKLLDLKESGAAESELKAVMDNIHDLKRSITTSTIGMDKKGLVYGVRSMQAQMASAPSYYMPSTSADLKSSNKTTQAQLSQTGAQEQKKAAGVKDYKANKSGWQLLSKGDVVVNSDSLAMGMGGNKGQFVQGLLNSMGGVGSGTTVTVPVTLNVGSVNGDVEDLVKKISPAIQQTFERMYYNKQKRVA